MVKSRAFKMGQSVSRQIPQPTVIDSKPSSEAEK